MVGGRGLLHAVRDEGPGALVLALGAEAPGQHGLDPVQMRMVREDVLHERLRLVHASLVEVAHREKGLYEGMVRLPQRKMQGFELPLGDAARRHVLQGPRVALDQRADRLARSASIRQPIDGGAGAFQQIVAEEQDFGQRQTRCRRRFAGRFRPDPVLRGHGRAHLSTQRACGAAHRWRSRRSAPSGMRSRPAALRASCCRFPWGSWPEPGRPLRSI